MARKRADIRRIRSETDIIRVAGQFLDLQRSGDRYVASCPRKDLHKGQDTNPSLTFYPGSPTAFCFGCRWHPDVFSFLEYMLHTDFVGALQWLERQGPLPMIEDRRRSRLHTPLTPLPMMVIEYWHKLALQSVDVMNYFHSRLLNDDTIRQYMLGWNGKAYVIPWWEGVPGESEVYGVKFRRASDEKPKYYGLEGRSQPRLFNKYILEDTPEEVGVFFGEFDALLATQDGLPSVSPTSGQNKWLIGWNKLFLNVEHIYIVPDVCEITAGYVVMSELSGSGLYQYPPGCGADYTEFRQMGYTIDDFREMVLVEQERGHVEVEHFWE